MASGGDKAVDLTTSSEGTGAANANASSSAPATQHEVLSSTPGGAPGNSTAGADAASSVAGTDPPLHPTPPVLILRPGGNVPGIGEETEGERAAGAEEEEDMEAGNWIPYGTAP